MKRVRVHDENIPSPFKHSEMPFILSGLCATQHCTTFDALLIPVAKNMAPKTKRSSETTSGKPRGVFAEIIAFAAQNKKWWLTPIIVVLAVLILLIVLGGSGVAPFIYSRF
jgi:hypothetical protein